MERLVMRTSNVASFTECVLQLVSNSLHAKATAIAIRIDVKKRYIQVVDNGTGIPEKVLDTVAKHDARNASDSNIQDVYNSDSKNRTLANICRLSDAVMISSRYHTSPTTYMKILKSYHAPNIVTIPERPTCGTTVSIYGFYELPSNKWNVSFMCLLLANIAMVNPQASFSIRDNEKEELVTKISKPRTSIHIFQSLYDREVSLNNMWYIEDKENSSIQFCAYIGLSKIRSDPTQFIFLNNVPVRCPRILREISNVFIDAFRSVRRVQRENAFILLFITCPEYIFTREKENELLQSINLKMFDIFCNMTPTLSKNVSRRVRSNENLIYNNADSLINMNLFKNPSILGQPLAASDEQVIEAVQVFN